MASMKSWILAVMLVSSGLASAAQGEPKVTAAPPPPIGSAAGDQAPQAASPPPLVKDQATGMELVFVKGGCYQMGDIYDDGSESKGEGPDEKPVHEVCVDDFYIGKYEVTRGQWRSLMGSDPSSSSMCDASDCPVDNVTWKDTQAFVGKLSARGGGMRYRLPTEAEWEYAARSGGKNERYSGGNDVDSVSWYEATARHKVHPDLDVEAHPVGTKAPNGLGIHDMSGNVYEITNDWYASTTYSSSPRDNPTGPSKGDYRVKRGGCANGDPRNSRVARRKDFEGPNPMTGFRLVRVP
jgi:sulfatase modifying factor 1